MSFYFDALEKAIRRHLQPDINKVLREADVFFLDSRQNSVNVPLQADVAVAYEADMARFVVHGRCVRYGRDDYLSVQSVFDSRYIANGADAAAYIEYVFEAAKRQMLEQLAQDEFTALLGRQKEGN